jgi:hypothetical protein
MVRVLAERAILSGDVDFCLAGDYTTSFTILSILLVVNILERGVGA